MIFIKYFKFSVLFIVLETITIYGFSQGFYTSMTRNLPVNIINGTGTNIMFDNDIPIGFTFSFYGGSHTILKMSERGYLYFNNQPDFSNSTLPTGRNTNIIAFAKSGGNLYPPPSSVINYFTTGTAPNRVLVINFRNYTNPNTQANIDIQIQLYESSNIIELHNVMNKSVSNWQVVGIQGDSYYLTDVKLNGNYFNGANAILNEMIRFVSCNGPLTRTPTISASSDSICTGQDVVLSAIGCLPSDTVRWSNGKTGKAIIEKLNGNISYTAKCVEPVTLCESSSNSNTKQIIVGYTWGVIPKPMIIGYKPSMSSVVGKIWDKRYGGNYGDILRTSIRTKDGGYLLGGTSSSDIGYEKTQDAIGRGDYWVVKIDSIGNKLWDKRYGGYEADGIISMIEVEGGSFLLAGYSKSPISSQGEKNSVLLGLYDYFIVKIDKNGNKIWDKSFGGNGDDVLSNIISINNGKEFILAGSTTTSNNLDVTQPTFGNNDYWIIKIDSSGNKKWNKRFGGSGDDYLKKIIATNDNNLLLIGSSYSPVSGNKTTPNKSLDSDFWIVKIDTSGNKLWDKTFGGSTVDILMDVVKNNDGSFVLAGTTNSTDGDITEPKKVWSSFSKDYWILKIDDLGNKIWDKRFSSGEGVSQDYLQNISNVSGIGYIISGVSEGLKGADKTEDSFGGSTDDFWVLGIDENGTKVWDKTYGGNGSEILSNIIFNTDGSFLMTGASNSAICNDITQQCRGDYDFFIEKSRGYFLEKNIKIGESLKLEVLGCVGSSIQWSDGNTNAIRTVTPNTTTNYTVTCKLSPCASVSSKIFTLNVLTIPPPSLSSNKSNVCLGSSAILTATGCIGTVSWNTTPIQTGTTISVTPTNTTSYTASCNVDGLLSENSLPITISVNPTSISSIISGMWNTPSTWSCNCVPTECSNVIIETNHIVTIPNNIIGNIKNLKINGQIDLKNTSGVFSH